MGKYILTSGESVELLSDTEPFRKHEELLTRLMDKKIMRVYIDDDGCVCIEECCDNCFTCRLSKEDCEEMSEIFDKLSKL